MNPIKAILHESITDMLSVWWEELKAAFKDQGVLIFFMIVPLGYPLLYTFIYTGETVREVPVAVVDDNRSSLSREFLRRVDASPDVHLVSYCSDLEEARELMRQEKVYGIVYVPSGFTADVARGVQARVSIYCNMAGMLYYKAVLTASTNASLEMNRQIKIERAGNTTDRQDEVYVTPLAYEDISIFNPQNGFASFLIPAVLILIIQQTLLLGVGLAVGTERETDRFRRLAPVGGHLHGVLRIVCGKSLAYFLIYAVLTAYMVCVVPRLFDLVQIARAGTLLLFMLPYLLACIFFAQTCSAFIHHREACMLVYVFMSVPLLFLSGISWPGAAVPMGWQVFSWIFPSTWGINGFVRISVMGATLDDVLTEWRALWVQAGFYFLTACLVYKRFVRMAVGGR